MLENARKAPKQLPGSDKGLPPVSKDDAETPCRNSGRDAETPLCKPVDTTGGVAVPPILVSDDAPVQTPDELAIDARPVLRLSVDPVEQALGDAVLLAAQAGQWETVALLSRELGARRLAREAPNVSRVDVERIRRGRG